MAAAATAAAVAGGVALRARRRNSRGIDVSGAIKQIGKVSKSVGKTSKQVSKDVRRLSEDIEKAGQDARVAKETRMAQTTSKPRKASSSRNHSSSSNGAGGVKRQLESAGDAVTSAAGKAKGPALAGGAALAGLVGGVALASRGGGRRRVLGMPVPGTRRALIRVGRPGGGKSARNFAKAAGQMAELATEVKLAREQLDGNNKVRRSPVEVVLDGLTARRPR